MELEQRWSGDGVETETELERRWSGDGDGAEMEMEWNCVGDARDASELHWMCFRGDWVTG